MSIEIHVFFRGKLPDTAALTRGLKGLGFTLSITPPAYPLEGHSGYMPMRFQRDETGVEFYIDDGRAVVEDALPHEQLANVDPGFDRCASFRWGSAEDEMVCGLCCAAALAKLVNGIVYEETDGVLWSTLQAIEEAKKHFEEFANKTDPTRGTRSSDIKRYLKSLLKQRSDLTLAGRTPGHPPGSASVARRVPRSHQRQISFPVMELHQSFVRSGAVYLGETVGDRNFYVWQPHFEPLLMDVLADDVFDKVGHISTFEDFANFSDTRMLSNIQIFGARVTSLVLSGEQERAAEYVQQIERDDHFGDRVKNLVKTQWDIVSRDIETVCAECHAKEAETIKELKLEHIWEPSPFPVEVPVAQRASQTAEPIFNTTPWIDRPTLLQEMPEKFGDIRFAKDMLERDGRPKLLAPIGRFEAGERHRDLESYVLAARLPDDLTLLLRRQSDLDRNDPDPMRYQNGPWINLVIELWGPSLVAVARASQDYDNKVLLHFDSVRIYEQQPRQEIWNYFVHDNSERSIS